MRCNNREEFPLEPVPLWNLVEEYLFLVSHGFLADVGAAVLMPNHLHLLLFVREQGLPQIMQYFLRELSREVSRQTQRSNHLFGNRYFSSVIKSEVHLQTVYKYIYLNPVKAGMTDSVLKYRFSTLPGQLGLCPLLTPVIDPLELVDNSEQILNWLDSRYDQQTWERIRKGLRRAEFKPASHPSRRKEPTDPVEALAALHIKKVCGTF